MKLSTLLFDVDGTLAETEEEHRKSFNFAFNQVGLDWKWSKDLYRELLKITGGKERINYFINTYCPQFECPYDKHQFISKLHEIKTEHYQSKLNSGAISLRPGIKRIINEAKASGIRLGIVTTTTPKNVTTLLEKSLNKDAHKWFDIIAAGNVVPKKKPAPDIYQYTLQKLNLHPNSCLAIEDSQNGLLSALHAGIKAIITVSEYTKHHDFNEAQLVVNHLGEINNPTSFIFGKLNQKPIVDIEMLMKICECE